MMKKILIMLSMFWIGAKMIGTENLDRIVVVSRHGDRAPLFSFPFEQNRNFFPFGYGQLTSNGKIRMYRVGAMLKRRYYRQYASWCITPRDVYIRSTSIDRCLETAQLIAAGLTPPSCHWIWNNELGSQWQPVPIYTTEIENDGMIYPSSDCARAIRLYEQLLNSKAANDIMSTNYGLLKMVSNELNKTVATYRDVRDLFDNLLILKHESRRLPSWANETIYKSLKEIFEQSFQLDFTGKIFPELRQLRAGVLLNEIFTKLDPVKSPNASKLSIYATHDSQMFHLLDALEMTPNKTLKFGSLLIFESINSAVRLYQVNVKTCNDQMQPVLLNFPGCEGKEWCPLEHLRQKYLKMFMTIDQWKDQCRLKWF